MRRAKSENLWCTDSDWSISRAPLIIPCLLPWHHLRWAIALISYRSSAPPPARHLQRPSLSWIFATGIFRPPFSWPPPSHVWCIFIIMMVSDFSFIEYRQPVDSYPSTVAVQVQQPGVVTAIPLCRSTNDSSTCSLSPREHWWRDEYSWVGGKAQKKTSWVGTSKADETSSAVRSETGRRTRNKIRTMRPRPRNVRLYYCRAHCHDAEHNSLGDLCNLLLLRRWRVAHGWSSTFQCCNDWI